jgi:hypothetical protein
MTSETKAREEKVRFAGVTKMQTRSHRLGR